MSNLPEEVPPKPTTTTQRKKKSDAPRPVKPKKAHKLGGIIKVEGPVVVTFN